MDTIKIQKIILRHKIKSNLLKANYRSYGTPISISSKGS